ncbi:hypothetical protein ACOME3_007055 [Neoechinorhynchus agilis]
MSFGGGDQGNEEIESVITDEDSSSQQQGTERKQEHLFGAVSLDCLKCVEGNYFSSAISQQGIKQSFLSPGGTRDSSDAKAPIAKPLFNTTLLEGSFEKRSESPFRKRSSPSRKDVGDVSVDKAVPSSNEDGEHTIVEMKCKLFGFSSGKGGWKDHGPGTLYLNDGPISSRILFRTAGSQRVILNTLVFDKMSLMRTSATSVRFSACVRDDSTQRRLFKVFSIRGSYSGCEELMDKLSIRIKTGVEGDTNDCYERSRRKRTKLSPISAAATVTADDDQSPPQLYRDGRRKVSQLLAKPCRLYHCSQLHKSFDLIIDSDYHVDTETGIGEYTICLSDGTSSFVIFDYLISLNDPVTIVESEIIKDSVVRLTIRQVYGNTIQERSVPSMLSLKRTPYVNVTIELPTEEDAVCLVSHIEFLMKKSRDETTKSTRKMPKFVSTNEDEDCKNSDTTDSDESEATKDSVEKSDCDATSDALAKKDDNNQDESSMSCCQSEEY